MRKAAYPSDYEARQEILDIGRRMYEKNYVAANDGNISCKVGPDALWATPTGVSKGFMRQDQLVKMRLNGTVIQMGALKPSSEIKMHLRLYNENPEIMGVAHAHPPICTSFAIAGLGLDQAIYPEALVNLGTVPCVHYEAPGSQGIPDSVAPFCRDYNAVLLANHGALSWGTTLMEAFFRLESMEHYAMVIMYTGNIIGRANVLSCDQVGELLKIRERLGVTTGGVPPCCAPAATNLRDSVAPPAVCPCGRKSPGCASCGVKAPGEARSVPAAGPAAASVAASAEGTGAEEDMVRLKSEVLKRLEPLMAAAFEGSLKT
ncbi:MAG: class II aldolase/adducin family protein [Treponema sp.]|nr:class II aldolase/adducin family protein [Treponema sp.]